MKRTVTDIRIDELDRFNAVIEDAIQEDQSNTGSAIAIRLILYGVQAEIIKRKRELRRRGKVTK